MNACLFALAGTSFTCLMTMLGAAMVFFFRRGVGECAQRICLGFAGGVMAAAAVFSLLNPAIEQAKMLGGWPFFSILLGFAGGAAALAGLDVLVTRLSGKRAEAVDADARRMRLMITAVTLHNIPEGMAVGLAFAASAEAGGAGLAAASALALGIGIQNIPEGAAVSLPLYHGGVSRWRSFWMGVLSGAVELAAGVLVVMATASVQRMMPALMAFAAGAMMLVVFSEMVPEAAQARWGMVFLISGYVIMMALDICLG